MLDDKWTRKYYELRIIEELKRVGILGPKIIDQEFSPTPFFVPHLIYENTLIKGKKTGICYVCQNCGYKTGRWLGRCPECQAWQTLLEEQEGCLLYG